VLRGVFFDMGGTLVTYAGTDDPWRAPVLEAIEREFGKRWWAEPLYAADIRRPPAGDPYRQETERWLAEWLRERGEDLDAGQIARLRRAFARPLPTAFVLAAGAAEALAWCRASGLAVAVLTNTLSRGDAEVQEDFQRLGLDGLVDHIATSYSTGWEKPHPAMFERALAEAGIAASEACMVGDILEVDVAGAKGLGMRAIWVRAEAAAVTENVRPDAEIESLRELPDTLGPWV
jgi:HAD superfamily hydrolase (TIGR01509 family)